MNDVSTIECGDAPDFRDTTDAIRASLREGEVLVFSRHASAAVRLQEAEPLMDKPRRREVYLQFSGLR